MYTYNNVKTKAVTRIKLECTELLALFVQNVIFAKHHAYQRFKEHLLTKSIVPPKSAFANHLINKKHSYNNCSNSLKILHINNNSVKNTLEEF